MQAHIGRPNLGPLIMVTVVVAVAAALALVVLMAANRTTGTVTNQLTAPAAQTLTETKPAADGNGRVDCAGERWRCQTAAASGNEGTIALGPSSAGSAGTGPTGEPLRANGCPGERWRC
jgi:membrane-bound ClpP family serine protease